MYKRIAFIAMLLLILCVLPVSAEWFTVPVHSCAGQSLGGDPLTGYCTDLTDGNTDMNNRWVCNGFSCFVNFVNPTPIPQIDAIRLHTVQTSPHWTSVSCGGQPEGAVNTINETSFVGTGIETAYVNGSWINASLLICTFSSDTWVAVREVEFGSYENPIYQPRLAEFSATPLTGNAPLTVNFTDISTPTGYSTIQKWSFGDGISLNGTYPTVSHEYSSAGVYSVRLDSYFPDTGWVNTTKSDYITALSIPISNTSFWATNYDPLKSAVVKPSDIKLQNLTSGFWRNVSSTGGTVKFTATDTALTEPITSGQTVKLCGYAPGYAEACANVTIPYSGWEYKINLASTGAVPTGTNATLFVNAIDSYTAAGLAGTTITIANASIPYSKSVLSNDAGIASFINIDPGTYSISATKTGYQSSVTSWTAPSGLVTNAYIGLLPVGMTPVVTGTGGENLYDDNGNPIIGYDLRGNPITAGPTPDTRTDEEKDSEMMDLLRDQGPMLIQFFIVCFVIYMIMGMAGKR